MSITEETDREMNLWQSEFDFDDLAERAGDNGNGWN